MDSPYKAASSHEDGYYVNGPASGGECGYYGGTLYPSTRLKTMAEAEIAAMFANIAFEQGYKQAQRDMQKCLGIVK